MVTARMNLYDHHVHFDKQTVDCTIAQLQSKGYDVGLTFVITVSLLATSTCRQKECDQSLS